MLTAFIGLVGILLGAFLNEILRRLRRAERYSDCIFQKRLQAYERLMDLISRGAEIVKDVTENPELTKEDRHGLVSSAIHPIAEHVDRNVLYIDEELATHCVALFMGTEDLYDSPAREKDLQRYRVMLNETRRMIAEDSGVAKINRLFKSINRPRITSPIIERVRELRKERRRKIGNGKLL
jgi:hypothetical protein